MQTDSVTARDAGAMDAGALNEDRVLRCQETNLARLVSTGFPLDSRGAVLTLWVAALPWFACIEMAARDRLA